MEKIKERENKQKKDSKKIEKVQNVKEKSQIKQDFIKVLKNNIIFIVGVVLLTYKAILLNLVSDIGIGKYMILITIIASMLLMCPTINNRKKFSYIYLNVVYGIISILIYFNYIYFKYSINFLSLYQIQNLQYAKEIGGGILVLANIANVLIFWTDNILLLIFSIIGYKKAEKIKYQNIFVKTILIIFIFALNFISVKFICNYVYKIRGYNKSLIVKEISIYYYHYEDIKDYISSLFVKEKVDTERLEKIYNENLAEKTKETKYTGIAQDKNVIIVQLESLNEYMINKRVNGKEVMPNLNKFYNENIYCKDMYNQGLGTTADSEFEMENSMFPLENGYVFQKYFNNTWLDIYTTLRKYGYYTSFMHPNTSTFWNRDEVYNVGYHIDEYNDIRKYPDIDQAGEFYSDEDFFVKSVEIMNNYDKRFCSTLVSVTTHIPFYLTGVSNLEDKLTFTKDELDQFTDDTFKNYILSCNFVDYAFGRFLEELEKTNLLDNSILIVYGDHGSGSSNDDIRTMLNENGLDYSALEIEVNDRHVPFGIRIPGVNDKEVIERSVSKIDIKPTIMDLLGLENNFSIGDTIFSENDYSFIKGLGFITSEYYNLNDIYYDRKTFEEVEPTEEMLNLANKMKDQIFLSDSIIKNNLLKK